MQHPSLAYYLIVLCQRFPTRKYFLARVIGLPDRHLNVKPSNTRKCQKISQTNFNVFFILTSHEKLQIHVITILPTGMSGTYGINLVRYEVFFSISGDAGKSLQHLPESSSSALTLTTVSRRFSCILFLAFVLTEDTRENIPSTTALLTGVTGQVRSKVASSLNA